MSAVNVEFCLVKIDLKLNAMTSPGTILRLAVSWQEKHTVSYKVKVTGLTGIAWLVSRDLAVHPNLQNNKATIKILNNGLFLGLVWRYTKLIRSLDQARDRCFGPFGRNLMIVLSFFDGKSYHRPFHFLLNSSPHSVLLYKTPSQQFPNSLTHFLSVS